MDNKIWSDDMGEISGFGGSYEDGCRAMVLAGIKWIDEHPDENLEFKGIKGVFGLIDTNNQAAEQLEAAIMNARCMLDGKEVRCGDESTGAMHHAAISHCLAYKRIGWEQYCKELRERTKNE